MALLRAAMCTAFAVAIFAFGQIVLGADDASMLKLRTSCPGSKKPLDYPLVQHWQEARELLGLSTHIDNHQKRVIEGIHSVVYGITRSFEMRTAYVNIFKCASMSISLNLKAARTFLPNQYKHMYDCPLVQLLQREVERCVPLADPAAMKAFLDGYFTWTMVREPLSHFASGYNEVEFRIHHWTHLFKDAGATFIDYPAGSDERFIAFVKDMLMLRFPVAGLHTSHNSHTVLMRHVFPMSGYLQHLKLDLIGDLADSSQVWRQVQLMNGVREADVVPMNRSLGQHQSSDDPSGTYGVSERVLKKNTAVKRALCKMLTVEYECLGYPLPDECK